MMTVRNLFITSLVALLVLASMIPASADPDEHDIASGGVATISSTAFGGSVTSNPSLSADLLVTVNFGEITPINTAPIIVATIPMAIRSRERYQITATVLGTLSPDPNAVKLTDIGFGLQNLRSLGGDASFCGAFSNIRSPFNNNPATSVTINPTTGRAQFPSTLANVGAGIIVMNGPRLSRNQGDLDRDPDNGYVIDVILAIVPQWYAAGSFTLTLRFSMSRGPSFSFLCDLFDRGDNPNVNNSGLR